MSEEEKVDPCISCEYPAKAYEQCEDPDDAEEYLGEHYCKYCERLPF